ncbi:hypothetical protein HBH56_242950 [Parastagonospora nodorum]|nr:hypothetical protein HBH56_242950 [Parastagonospora nodorum]KAH4561250.1 hypothetical protein HBH84_191460 [Parastagonospora nodorum]KAH4617991.1 hypothetical protein HBH81_245060 [Parastagonospora nodorum]
MLQTNVREGYKIITLEVVKLIEDLISYFSSVMSNRSTALITNKFSVALLTKPAILNNANIALVDAMHYSVVIDALIITLIKNNNDLLGTVNSYIKLRRLRATDLSLSALGKEAQLKKTRDEEELAKLDSLLDSDDYCLDSSLDINSKDNLEDKEATTAKDLNITQLMITISYILLKARERSTARAKGASPLMLNLNKQLQ